MDRSRPLLYGFLTLLVPVVACCSTTSPNTTTPPENTETSLQPVSPSPKDPVIPPSKTTSPNTKLTQVAGRFEKPGLCIPAENDAFGTPKRFVLKAKDKHIEFCAPQGNCWSVHRETALYRAQGKAKPSLVVPWILPAKLRRAPKNGRWEICDAKGCVTVIPPDKNIMGLSCSKAAIHPERKLAAAIFYRDEYCEGIGQLAVFDTHSGRHTMYRPTLENTDDLCAERIEFLRSDRIHTSRNVCAGPGTSDFIYNAQTGELLATTITRESYEDSEPKNSPPKNSNKDVVFAPANSNTYGSWPIQLDNTDHWLFWDGSGRAMNLYDLANNRWQPGIELEISEEILAIEPEGVSLVSIPGTNTVALMSRNKPGDLLLVDLAQRRATTHIQAPRCPKTKDTP